MGWVEAVVTVVTALVWPSVVVFAVLVLRKELAGLVGRMSRLTAPGVEAEFGIEVSATAEIAEAVVPNPPPTLVVPESEALAPQPSLADLLIEARRHPVGGMVRAWNLIEQLSLFTPGVRISRQKIAAVLGDAELGDEMWSVYRRLSQLRSQVVHGQAVPTVAEAEEFVNATWRLLAYVVQAQESSNE